MKENRPNMNKKKNQIEGLLYKFRRSGAEFKYKDKRKEKKVISCQTRNNYSTHATKGGRSCRGESININEGLLWVS